MAEAIGLAASVIAVAQTAWTVAEGLYDLADQVGTAGEAVRIFANDFKFFVENLKELGELLDGLPSTSRQAESATEDILKVAMDQIVQPFQIMLHDLQPLLDRWHDSPSRMKQLGVRLQWAFSYKRKVLFFHGALNALKSNVSLLLQTMALRGQYQPHIYFILRGSIESTKSALSDSTRQSTLMLLHSGQVAIEDECMNKPNAASSATSLSIVHTTPLREQTSLNRDANALGAGMVIIASVDQPEEAFAGISLLADDAPKDIEGSREQVELVGAICTVQRKIFKLADEAVATSLRSSDRIKTSIAQSETSNTTTTNRNTLTAQPGRSTYPLQPQTVVSEASKDTIRFLDTLGNDFEIPFVSIRSWQAMKRFMITEYSWVRADIMDVANLDEKVKRKALHDAGYDRLHYQAPERILIQEVALTESDNERATVQMPSDLNSIMDELPHLLAAIKDEKFTMFYRVAPSEQKQMVLRDFWESNVRSGWIVELLFDQDTLNKFKNNFPPSHRRIRYAQMAALDPNRTPQVPSLEPLPSKGETNDISSGPGLRSEPKGEKSHKSVSKLISKLGNFNIVGPAIVHGGVL